MPNVTFVRTEINDLKARWELIRDCISGEEKIKQQREKYLPHPMPSDESPENQERYNQYIFRAVFYGVTGRTLRGLIGEVFCKDPVSELPTALDMMKLDVDGGAVTLDQQAKKALAYALAFGRFPMLVDFPQTEGPTSQTQAVAGNVRPTIIMFEPWQVINWRCIVIGAKRLLSLVVIQENNVVNDDGFEHKYEEQFRVLRLRQADMIYQVEFWKPIVDSSGKRVAGAGYAVADEDMMTPLDGTGKPWKEIPFLFGGSENNDDSCDLPPLFDMASLNVAHYRNSADYEESCFWIGQPTPWFSGLTEYWVKEVLKGQAQLGSRGAILLPENAAAGLLQADPNQMVEAAMMNKERQMVALGAKLVEQKQVQRTAMEAGLEEAAETSVLSTCAKNVSAAYTQCLKWALLFITGQPDDTISYELNSELAVTKLDSLTLAAVIAAWQANAITKEEMRDNLTSGGYAYQDMDEYQAAIDAEGPSFGVPVGQQKIDDASAAADLANKAVDAKNQPPAGPAKRPVIGVRK